MVSPDATRKVELESYFIVSDVAHKGYNIALLEDNDDDEKIALRAFRRCPLTLEVSVARDGEEALRLLGLDAEDEVTLVPDLILSDLKMPKLTGADVLKRAKANERLRDVPFVIFTSSDDEADVQRCMELGASAYCRKPIGFSEYVACVTDIVEKWLPTNGNTPEPACELQSAQEPVVPT